MENDGLKCYREGRNDNLHRVSRAGVHGGVAEGMEVDEHVLTEW